VRRGARFALEMGVQSLTCSFPLSRLMHLSRFLHFWLTFLVCVFGLASRALAQAPTPTPSALSAIFSNKGELGLGSVTNTARSQTTTTPNYKSNGLETRTFDGFFQAASNTSKLAILSDDGSSVSVDGRQILNRAGQGQGFENFDSCFAPLTYSFTAGQTYHITVQYTNTVHLGDADVDGVSLWAYDGGGGIVAAPSATQTVTVSVGTDSNGTPFDHLEANGSSTTSVKVHFSDSSGAPVSGLPVNLATSEGQLTNTQMLTDSAGNTFVDTNGNGQHDTGEPFSTTLTSDTTGGWATITASVGNAPTGNPSGTRTVLMHRVKVGDFSHPKLLAYEPDSSDVSKSSPKMTFTIGNTPQVGTAFSVKETIYSLSGHDPLAIRTESLAAGTYSRSWSDFFYKAGETPNGRNIDPGEGIYPFQIEVTTTQVDAAALLQRGVQDARPRASDWKDSKSLTIKPHPQNAYSLSYNESTSQTMLTYAFDVVNSPSTTAPGAVQVDVYDPDGNNVGSVTDQLFPNPTVSTDGHTFTYYMRGPVTITSAGTYHFVAEAQQANALSEGKDAGKWGLEQNSSANIPTYVTFGGISPAVSALAAGQSMDTSDSSQAAGDALSAMMYKSNYGVRRHWWMQNAIGTSAAYKTINGVFATTFGQNLPTLAQVVHQPIQYHAVWYYSGHGATFNDGSIMAVWNASGLNGNRANAGIDDANWSYFTSTRSALSHLPSQDTNAGNLLKESLEDLPSTLAGGGSNGYGAPWIIPPHTPLDYARLLCFMGCQTANGTATDFPSMAVQKGASTAIGYNSFCPTPGSVNTFTSEFFDLLKSGKSVQYATEKASGDVYGNKMAVEWRGIGATTLTGAGLGWGDASALGPEQK